MKLIHILYTVLFFFLIGLSSCMTAKDRANLNRNVPLPDSLFDSESGTYKYSPCKDSLYLVLKKTLLDSMTERQYEYFLTKEKECATYNQVLLQTEPADKIADQYSTNSEIWIGIAVATVLAGIVVLIITGN